MRTIADLTRMARREVFLALLSCAPPVKRRLICCARRGTPPPVFSLIHRYTRTPR